MDTEIRAADSILDRGVRFKMPAPWIIRVLHLNRIRVKASRPGAILEFSKVVIKHGLTGQMTVEQMQNKLEPLSECLAITVLNGRLRIKYLKRLATRWFLWRCHYTQLIEMFVVLQRLNQMQDFTHITRFYYQQTKMMMSPRNLGQKQNGG